MPSTPLRDAPDQGRFPLWPFVRASGLHSGAAAAAASLRHDLVETRLSSHDFDEAFAVARLTPGTNLLAMYTLLGRRLSGWQGAVAALAIGTVIPAALAVLVTAAYVRYAAHPFMADVMQGARAGGIAVFVWGAVRLMRPQLSRHRVRGAAVALAALAAIVLLQVPPVVVLLVAGGLGARFMRSAP